MEYVLIAENLGKKYGKFKALDGFCMHIPKGAIYGFIGKNGAGKTTVLRLICGLQAPTEGSFRLYGIENSDRKIVEARRHLGAVIESPAIYPDMTAEDNLKQQVRMMGLSVSDNIPHLLKLVGLEDVGKKKAKTFSLGMKQRLGIAIALTGNPNFLVLDEPTNGLDPQGIVELRELILKLNREYRVTVLISSHILDELARVATHYGIIDAGRMVREISAEELATACRKYTRIKVSDMTVLTRVLNGMGLDYKVFSETQADIFTGVKLSQLILALEKEDCEVLAVETKDENLESYFIAQTGGNGDAQTVIR